MTQAQGAPGADEPAERIASDPFEIIIDEEDAIRDRTGRVITGEPRQARQSTIRQDAKGGADLEQVEGSIDLDKLVDRAAGERLEEEHHVIRASRRIHATPEECFQIVADPTRHDELEAKAMIVQALDHEPLTGVGETFRMAMHTDELGDYVMVNEVTEFEQDRVIAWKPLREGTGDEPVGFRWRWSFEPIEFDGAEDGDADSPADEADAPRTSAGASGAVEIGTFATLQYDWLDVANEKFLERRRWPTFPPEHYLASVRALAVTAEGKDAS